MNKPRPNPAPPKTTLFVGIDWADQKHDVFWMHLIACTPGPTTAAGE